MWNIGRKWVKFDFIQPTFLLSLFHCEINKCGKVLKNGPSKIYGRQSLKNCAWSILESFAPNDIHHK